MKDTLCVILAAGKGTRMRSVKPKLLHTISGRPIIEHVVRHVVDAQFQHIAVVVGWHSDEIQAVVKTTFPKLDIDFILQPEARGTGDALRVVLEKAGKYKNLFVLNGDQPLLSPVTMNAMHEYFRDQKLDLVMLSAFMEDPTGYGRVVRDDDGKAIGIVEEKDADEEILALDEAYVGVMAGKTAFLKDFVAQADTNNAQGEYYITDSLKFAAGQGANYAVLPEADEIEVMQVNNRVQLGRVEGVMNYLILEDLMEKGVTVRMPETVSVELGCEVGQDTEIMPFVRIEAGTVIGKGCVIGQGTILHAMKIGDECRVGPYNVLENSELEPGVSTGPFNHIRPDTLIKSGAKLGNYVEVKHSVVDGGSKINHQSYIGDATIGKNVNVGAGTITCNYDGYAKHPTIIEDGVFIGSDTQLVAPVEVGKDAYIGAGTTVTKNVPKGALALSRVPQTHIMGYAARKKTRTEED